MSFTHLFRIGASAVYLPNPENYHPHQDTDTIEQDVHSKINMYIKDFFLRNMDRTLIGVYDYTSGTAYLAPAINKRVYLVEQSGKFTRGWEINDNNTPNLQKPVSNLEIFCYNTYKEIPRACMVRGPIRSEYKTSHEYLLLTMNEQENVENYLGFSVNFHQKNSIEYTWISGSLNHRDTHFRRIRSTATGRPIRLRGATVPEKYQKEITALITRWI